LQAVQEENASLRVELTAKDATITDLRTRVERLESTFPPPNSGSAPFNTENSALGRRLAELTILQSKTLALVEKLVPQVSQSESPDEIQRRRNDGIRMLESELVEQQRKAESAKQKVEELRTALRVPADVAARNG
jgi:HD-GYP domain-containing protein (c-di-GMP phosphodiesterase class II)